MSDIIQIILIGLSAFLCLAGAVVCIYSSLAISGNVWHWCERCKTWHSRLGERKDWPDKGDIGSNELCDTCLAREAN